MIRESVQLAKSEKPRLQLVPALPKNVGGDYSGDELADFFLNDYFAANGTVAIKCQSGVFSIFNDRCYQVETMDSLRSRLDTYLRRELPQKTGTPVEITSRLKKGDPSVHRGPPGGLCPQWDPDSFLAGGYPTSPGGTAGHE